MRKFVIISSVFIFVLISHFIYQQIFCIKIVAKFEELRPMHKYLPVYYKGIVIGKGLERKHSKDYKHTYIKIILFDRNILLPSNTMVLLKKEIRNKKEKDFLELIYPKNPTKVMLSNGSEIEGKATVDITTFISNQHPDTLEEIRENLLQSSENLETTLYNLNEIFILLQDLIRDNEQNLKETTKNFAKTSKNIDNTTKKIDNSLKQENLNTAFLSFNSSLSNIEKLTNTSDLMLNDFKVGIPNINSTISNLNTITCGIRKTLSKPFGVIRLFFGKVIN